MRELMLHDVAELVGLERELTVEEFLDDVMPASIVAFADGELHIGHERYTDPGKVALYGETEYREGSVARRLGGLALENGLAGTPVMTYQLQIADYFDDFILKNKIAGMPTSTVVIEDDSIIVSGHDIAVDAPVTDVIDYGAGLAGLNHIDRQCRSFLEEGRIPYRYAPVSRLPFTTRVLLRRYDTRRAGLSQIMLGQGYFAGMSNGMAQASADQLDLLESIGLSTEVADVVMACGVYMAKPEDIQKTITNACRLVRAGGLLVLKSLAQGQPGITAADPMINWALQAGFDERSMQVFNDTDTRPVRRALLGIESQPVRTAVLRKPH